jgi:hypothetical protein
LLTGFVESYQRLEAAFLADHAAAAALPHVDCETNLPALLAAADAEVARAMAAVAQVGASPLTS